MNRCILDLLKRKQKDYLTLRSVRDLLPKDLLNSLGLKKGQSTLTLTKKVIRSRLGEQFKIFEGSRTCYLGLNLSIEEMILKKIQQKPDLSSKQLRNQLPYNNADFIIGINKLLSTARIYCELHPKTHLPRSFSLVPPSVGMVKDHFSEDISLFKQAFLEVGKGRQFVRIHEIRAYLNWSNARFNATIEKLKSKLIIQLQGGDPSLLTKEELENSYTDAKGRIRITVNWMK